MESNYVDENWFEKYWYKKWNVIRLLFEAFFCEKKNGEDRRTFSSKKFWAFVLVSMAIMNHLDLHIRPNDHWTVALTKKHVSSGVAIALIASLDALAAWALSVYGYCKVRGGA